MAFPRESQHQSCETKHRSLSISVIMGFSETRTASVNQILPVDSVQDGAESPGMSHLDFSS